MTATDQASYVMVDHHAAERRLRVSGKNRNPERALPAGQEIRLYAGGLRLGSGFAIGAGPQAVPSSVVVDGDLTVDGDLVWSTAAGGLLLVTGSLRAHNVLLGGCPDMVVRGDLTAVNAIHGSYDSAGGRLAVDGRTTARTILNPPGGTMTFATKPQALLIGNRMGYPTHFHCDELSEVVRPDLLDREGQADQRKIRAALSAGRGILESGTRVGPGVDVW